MRVALDAAALFAFFVRICHHRGCFKVFRHDTTLFHPAAELAAIAAVDMMRFTPAADALPPCLFTEVFARQKATLISHHAEIKRRHVDAVASCRLPLLRHTSLLIIFFARIVDTAR